MTRFKSMALCGALMAAPLLGLTACSAGNDSTELPPATAATPSDKTVVATVSGSKIFAADVRDAALMTGQVSGDAPFTRDNPMFDTLLPEVIDQRLLSLKARADGLHKTADAKHRIALAQERILANMAVQAHIEKEVTPQAARALYDAQIKLRQTGQEARAAHILVATQDEANAIAKRLAAGEDFAALATAMSIDRGTQTQGGDLGWFQADAMVADFSKAVFALTPGEVSAPFETQFGWHIAKLSGKRDAPVPSYDDMQDELLNYLTMDTIGKYLEDLREAANIEIVPVTPAAAPAAVPATDPANDSANDPAAVQEQTDEP